MQSFGDKATIRTRLFTHKKYVLNFPASRGRGEFLFSYATFFSSAFLESDESEKI